MYAMMVGKPRAPTLDTAKLLINEINYLEDEEIIPVYVDKKHMIQGYDFELDASDKPIVKECQKKEVSCLCVCDLEDGCSGQGLKECMDVTYFTDKVKIHLDSDFYIGPTEKITNHLLVLEGDTVTITATPGLGVE